MPIFGESRSRLLLCALATLKLTACGSGDHSGSAKLALPGVTYESPSFQGVISERGEFDYRAGELTRFSLAGIELGEVAVKGNLAISDLFAESLPESTLEFNRALNNEHRYDRDMRIAMNKLVWLAVLDVDADASNGFDVRHWGDDVPGRGYSFDQKTAYFYHIDLAKDAVNYPIVLNDTQTARQLAYVFKQAGIELAAQFRTRQQDYNLMVEPRKNTRGTSSEFNDQGDRVSISYENEGQLTSSIHTQFTYDDKGNQIAVLSESKAADNTVTRRYEGQYEFDNFGRMLSKVKRDDTDVNGIDDSVREEVWLFNEKGQLQSKRSTQTNSEAQQVANLYVDEYEYDAQGNRILEVWRNGVVDSEELYVRKEIRKTYDDARRLLTHVEFEDYNGDGNMDREKRISNQWHQDGRLLLQEEFDTRYGSVTNRSEYSYDEAGLLIKVATQTFAGQDTSVAPIAKNVTLNIYDDAGQLLTKVTRKDNSANDMWYTSSQSEFTYDAEGNQTQALYFYDEDGSGLWNRSSKITRVFDAFGLVTEQNTQQDNDADGQFDTGSLETKTFENLLMTSYQQIKYLTDVNFPTYKVERQFSFDELGYSTQRSWQIDSNHDAQLDVSGLMTFEYVTVDAGIEYLLRDALEDRP